MNKEYGSRWRAARALALVAGMALMGVVAPQRYTTVQAQGSSESVYALTSGNRLIQFNSTSPGILIASRPIIGLQSGENLLGIDFRPADGRLYGLGSNSRLYTLNPQTGAASLVAFAPFTSTLSGASFGFDFNPVPDRIRVVSDADQDLRLNPNNGVTAGVDATLVYTDTDPNAGANPNVVGAAYTRNVSGTTTTTLYGIDSALNILVRQGGVDGPPSPNLGVLFTVGALGLDVSDSVGFDISPAGTAYAAFTAPAATSSSFHTIDLNTGLATLVGTIGGPETIVGLAVPTVPPPPLPQESIYAVSSANRLIQFNSATPGTLTASRLITGLQSGENVLGIDFRPADGGLYALGSTSRVYSLNPQTGLATAIGTQPFTSTLSGAAFGFDFNPMPDRIRKVSNDDQNLRLNPITGGTAGVDSTLVYTPGDPNFGANPNVVAAAYTNNVSGTTTTTLYVIDSASDTLARQGGVDGPPSPNTGLLTTIGPLGADTSDLTAFDISTASGLAFASLTSPSSSTSDLALVNLATGLVTRIGTIAGGETIIGLSVPTRPAPALPADRVYAVTEANKLLWFNSNTPNLVTTLNTLTGLQAGETILGLDFRPADGQLYGLGSSSRVYTINIVTGAAIPIPNQPLTTTLSGTSFGFDFNPVPDRIRVVSNDEQNLRLNPINGAIAGIDATLAYTATDVNAGANPSIVSAAYTNNFSGTVSTTLFVMDSALNVLALQGGANGTPSPNLGQLTTVGALGVDASDVVGFDIAPSGAAYAAVTAAGGASSNFYTVDLTTGKLNAVGPIGIAEKIVAMSSPTLSLTNARLILPLVYK
jgi:hypothetical protein